MLLRPFAFCFLALKKSSKRPKLSNNCFAGAGSLYVSLTSLTLLGQPRAPLYPLPRESKL